MPDLQQIAQVMAAQNAREQFVQQVRIQAAIAAYPVFLRQAVEMAERQQRERAEKFEQTEQDEAGQIVINLGGPAAMSCQAADVLLMTLGLAKPPSQPAQKHQPQHAGG